MSYWTTLAVVAGYGTLFLLSDNRQKRQARELQPCQKASSQLSSSSRSSLSSSPSSPLFPVSCGVFEDLKRVAAEEDQKEDELWRRSSRRRRSIRTKREKEFRPVGSACSSSATCLPSLSSSSSCSCVIRKSAAVSPSLSSSTGGCGGSTGEKSQSPCSSCSRLQASTSVSARILSDDGSNGRENLDDGNDAKNLDDDDNDAWSLDDSNDEGNLDDDKDERNVDDDGNDGRMLEKSEAHRLTGARRMIPATVAAADNDDDDDDDEVDCSKWNNSIHLDDIHLPDFVSRPQDDEWRHFGGQEVVKTRVSKDEKQFIGRDKWKSRQKRSLQDNASRKTNLLDNTKKLSHETNLRHNRKPSHKTKLPNNTGPSHKTNLRNYTETSHRTNLTNNTERARETNLPNTETQKRNVRSNKNPSHKANLPTNAESSYKTKLRDKKQQHESNLPNNKQRAKTNLPSYSEEQDIAILAKNAQPSYSATFRINAESECERNIGKNTESSAGKVAASTENSSANDVISTSFCCNQDSEDVIHQLTDRHSSIESTALSDINCNLTTTLSCSLLINQPSVKKAGHNRKSTTTGETKDGLRDYPSGANWNSFSCSQETITNKRSRTYAAGVSDCCNCDSTDTPPKRNSRDGTPIGKNSSTGFDFERFRFYDQPVHFRHDNENANVGAADLLRRKLKTEKELCRSDVIPSREEQSMTNCTEYDSKQRSHETKEPCAEIGVVTPSASAVQSNGTKSLVRWSFMTILYRTFFILLFVLIVLYTLDYLFDLSRSKGHKRTDSEELQFSCGDQLTVSCDDKD